MESPTTRVLTVLEMLQSHGRVTGAEIAQRLEVNIRTVRRYIGMLEELGIPVGAERGRYGAYFLVPGFKLPPLMLNEEEALAAMLGLLAARQLGLTTTAAGVEGARAKLARVLPVPLREKVRAVEETLVLDLPARPGQRVPAAASEIVVALSEAARCRRRVLLRYAAPDGAETERAFDPYGVVRRHAYGYVVGYCHLRQDLRLFRLDRIRAVAPRPERFERPAGFDARDAVQRALGSVPRRWPVEVWLQTTLEEARRWIAPEVALLEAEEDGLLLRGSTDNLAWLARLLGSVGCPLVVRRPPELNTALREHALLLLRMAEAGEEARA